MRWSALRKLSETTIVLLRQDLTRQMRQVVRVNRLRRVASRHGLVVQLLHPRGAPRRADRRPAAEGAADGHPPSFHEALSAEQRVPHIAPHGDVEWEGVPELRRIVADPDDGTGGGEAEIRRIAARVLPIAHAAHDVVALFGDRLDAADVVRVMHGEAAVVEDPGGDGQRRAARRA